MKKKKKRAYQQRRKILELFTSQGIKYTNMSLSAIFCNLQLYRAEFKNTYLGVLNKNCLIVSYLNSYFTRDNTAIRQTGNEHQNSKIKGAHFLENLKILHEKNAIK